MKRSSRQPYNAETEVAGHLNALPLTVVLLHLVSRIMLKLTFLNISMISLLTAVFLHLVLKHRHEKVFTSAV